ncbi:MAG: hypothetical protein QHH06_10415 [Clostridiales bacterium]|nr:hypothetical protein [Eubacteriales bacterium]MDH7566879.1 hypothetical protein [Clostridiales bacterium]
MFDDNYKKQAEFEQNLETFKDGVKQMLDVIPHLAKLYMEYFKALKKEGFTDEQAIYLIGQHGTSLGIKGQY